MRDFTVFVLSRPLSSLQFFFGRRPRLTLGTHQEISAPVDVVGSARLLRCRIPPSGSRPRYSFGRRTQSGKSSSCLFTYI